MTPAIAVTALSVAHGDRPILADLSFTVAPGARVVLTGNNGAGKSTLLSALAGVFRTSSVMLHGRSNTEADARVGLSWCPGGARLPQAWTPRELLALRRAQRSTSSAATMALRVHDLLDQRIDTLSAGERQRVALSLALTGSPDIVLLDEPLEHLDAEGRAAVVTLIQALPETTFVIATHRPDDWRSCATRTLQLHDAVLEEL